MGVSTGPSGCYKRAPGRVERGFARLERVCLVPAKRTTPLLLLMPCGPFSASQQGGRSICQSWGSASRRPQPRRNRGSWNLSGWGRTVWRGWAGATGLGLPGWRNQFICSQVLACALRGGAVDWSASNPVIRVSEILILQC